MRFSSATRLAGDHHGTLTGVTSDDYWNTIGPFGGWIAAVLMRGVIERSGAGGEPVSASVTFAAAIAPGAFEIRARELRANRSTAFWFAELLQVRDVAELSCAQATIVLATRRETPVFRHAVAPEAPPPEDLPRGERLPRAPAFLEHYDMRFVRGGFRESEPPESTFVWVRDLEPEAPLDFPTLAGLCDIGLPQIFYRSGGPIPISTIVMNAFFHASAADLAALRGEFLGYHTRMRLAANGYFDMTTEIWSRAGALLATTEQIVWYKFPDPPEPHA